MHQFSLQSTSIELLPLFVLIATSIQTWPYDHSRFIKNTRSSWLQPCHCITSRQGHFLLWLSPSAIFQMQRLAYMGSSRTRMQILDGVSAYRLRPFIVPAIMIDRLIDRLIDSGSFAEAQRRRQACRLDNNSSYAIVDKPNLNQGTNSSGAPCLGSI